MAERFIYLGERKEKNLLQITKEALPETLEVGATFEHEGNGYKVTKIYLDQSGVGRTAEVVLVDSFAFTGSS
jgi:hypothetical protein